MKYQKTTIKQAAKLLVDSQSVALFAHTNPDGDTVGSCVALCLALRSIGRNCQIFCDSPLNETFQKFEHTSLITNKLQGNFDLFVAVDCGDVFRTGEFADVYADFTCTLTIDHHCGTEYSRHNCLYNYASTCQIIYEILLAADINVDSTIATYLYMGLCTDTGNFMNSNTDKASFLTAAQLVDCGADTTRVCRTFFREKSLVKTKLIGCALDKLRVYHDGQLVLLHITQDDFAKTGASTSDTNILVGYAIDIDTARVGVCISEFEPEVFKVSMRGKDVCVRDVCQEFGGGGHEFASGCKISGPLEEVIEKIVRTVGFCL